MQASIPTFFQMRLGEIPSALSTEYPNPSMAARILPQVVFLSSKVISALAVLKDTLAFMTPFIARRVLPMRISQLVQVMPSILHFFVCTICTSYMYHDPFGSVYTRRRYHSSSCLQMAVYQSFVWVLCGSLHLEKISAPFVRADYMNIQYKELLCRGWFLPPNTYDCGSFVVNGTAVVGKEPNKPYNRCKSTQKGAELYEISI